MADEQNFEHLMQQLEQLVTRMESGELSLEESLQAFEQGVGLTRSCQTLLTQAEQRVSRLQENQGQAAFEKLPGGGVSS